MARNTVSAANPATSEHTRRVSVVVVGSRDGFDSDVAPQQEHGQHLTDRVVPNR